MSPIEAVVAGLLFGLLVSTALRPSYKYLGSIWIWIAYVLVALGLIYAVLAVPKLRLFLLNKPTFTMGVVSLYAALNIVFYPLADGLKTLRQGQDQDDCTILVIEQLLTLDFPYDQTSYFGNPCSPLFGALIPYIPFVAVDAFLLANSFILAVSAWLVFRLSGSIPTASLAILISLGIPQTLELLVNGSDFIFMGFGLLICGLLMRRAQVDSRYLLLSSVLVGVLASTRVSMPILGLAYVVWLFTIFRPRVAALHSLASAGVAMVPSGLLFLVSPEEFSPLHLVAKGQRLVPGTLYIVMIAATLLALIAGAFLLRKKLDANSYLLLTLLPHLAFLTYGDLVFNRNMDFFWWEGASYLMVITPAASYLIAEITLRAAKSGLPQ